MGQPAQFGTHKAKLSLSNIIYSQQKCDKPVLPCPPPSGSPGLVSEVINTLMAGMGGMPPLLTISNSRYQSGAFCKLFSLDT